MTAVRPRDPSSLDVHLTTLRFLGRGRVIRKRGSTMKTLSIVVLCWITVASNIQAQRNIPALPGQQIRVLSTSGSAGASTWISGTVLRARHHSLIVAVPGVQQLLELDAYDVSELHVRIARRPPAVAGARTGMRNGAVLGLLAGMLSNDNCRRGCNPLNAVLRIGTRLVLGGAAGAVVGAIIGTATARDPWQQANWNRTMPAR